MGRRKKTLPKSNLGDFWYTAWDIHDAIGKAIDEFERVYGHKPKEVLVPGTIKGVPIFATEDIENLVAVGPIEKERNE